MYHPPFALQLERAVPQGGFELPNGIFLHEGTKMGIFGYTMHLDEDVYGEDAESFNPNRWLPRVGEYKSKQKRGIVR